MGTAVQPWGGVSSSHGSGGIGVTHGVVFAGIVLAPSLQAAVPIGIAYTPQVGVKRFQRFGQLGQVFGILAAQIVKIQRRFREAEALELVELRHHFAINHRNAAGNPPVRTLVAHKHQAVVQAGSKITAGIHCAAHGLGFQPDFFIAAALNQNGVAAKVF